MIRPGELLPFGADDVPVGERDRDSEAGPVGVVRLLAGELDPVGPAEPHEPVVHRNAPLLVLIVLEALPVLGDRKVQPPVVAEPDLAGMDRDPCSVGLDPGDIGLAAARRGFLGAQARGQERGRQEQRGCRLQDASRAGTLVRSA